MTRPVIVVLKPLLQNCLIRGTKAHEHGLTVSIEPQPDEKVYFFHVDCKEGNQCLGMNKQEKEKCNDYLVFYSKETNVNEVLCFLELKGQDIRKAKEQVINTHDYIKALLKDKVSQSQKHFILSVYICLSGPAPQQTQRVQNKLIARFGRGRIRIRTVVKKDNTEFPRFLRELG